MIQSTSRPGVETKCNYMSVVLSHRVATRLGGVCFPTGTWRTPLRHASTDSHKPRAWRLSLKTSLPRHTTTRGKKKTDYCNKQQQLELRKRNIRSRKTILRPYRCFTCKSNSNHQVYNRIAEQHLKSIAYKAVGVDCGSLITGSYRATVSKYPTDGNSPVIQKA